jgi:hypothetical protein
MAGWSLLEKSTSCRGSPLIISTFVIRKKPFLFPESSCVVPVPLVSSVLKSFSFRSLYQSNQQYLLKAYIIGRIPTIRFHKMQIRNLIPAIEGYINSLREKNTHTSMRLLAIL